MTIGAEDNDSQRCLGMPGEAVRDALGAAGGTLAMLTPHPAGSMPCLGKGGSCAGSACRSPQPQPSDRYASAGQAATRAWTGASSSLWAQRLPSDGEACNPEGLAESGGKRHSFRRGKCLTTSSPWGWSGAPISQANQPGKGLILGLCQVISSLVHLCSV